MHKRPSSLPVLLYVLFLFSLVQDPTSSISPVQALTFVLASICCAIELAFHILDGRWSAELSGSQKPKPEEVPAEQVALLMDRAQLYEMWPELDPEYSEDSEPSKEPDVSEESAAPFHDFTGKSAPKEVFDESGWGPVVPVKDLGKFVH